MQASLNGSSTTAFLDTGAAANFMSLAYARQHGYAIKRSSNIFTIIGNGSKIKVLGTTTLPFSFESDDVTHSLIFNVLDRCSHDVVLGSRFLKLTETFTKFAHRIRERVRKAFTYRVCLADHSQYVTGRFGNVPVDAVPDSGADVPVVSARYAKEQGFIVNTAEENRILFEFADGSTTRADGVIENIEWQYGTHGMAYLTKWYVLPGLPVDVVLGYDFLCQTSAWVLHADSFWDAEDGKAVFGYIKIANCECSLLLKVSKNVS